MVKYKCVKTQCPICGNFGSLQIFINKSSRITYARIRHYNHTDKESHKPQFTYHKIEDLEKLKTSHNGQAGQGPTANNIDPKLKDSSLKGEMAGPLGFEPRTFSLEG